MGLLETSSGTLVLPESDQGTIQRHSGFQVFAAMNPATDSGKKHLPVQIRSHFTEIYVAEPTAHEDLVRCQEPVLWVSQKHVIPVVAFVVTQPVHACDRIQSIARAPLQHSIMPL